MGGEGQKEDKRVREGGDKKREQTSVGNIKEISKAYLS